MLKDIHMKDKDNLQVNAQKALLGAIVMTRLFSFSQFSFYPTHQVQQPDL